MASATLPAPVMALLDGRNLEQKVGHTLLLVACEPEGWPRMAMLSVGEVLAVSDQEVRLALYADSGTTRALQASGKALLVTILDRVSYKIRLQGRAVAEDDAEVPADVQFVCEVRRVDEDRVSYATVEHGIEFTLTDESAVLERWQRSIDRLASLAP